MTLSGHMCISGYHLNARWGLQHPLLAGDGVVCNTE